MAYNLFISYELKKKDGEVRDHKPVMKAIKQQGSWAHDGFFFFYVHTERTPQEVFAAVGASLRDDDRLVVIDAKQAVGGGVKEKVWNFITSEWIKP